MGPIGFCLCETHYHPTYYNLSFKLPVQRDVVALMFSGVFRGYIDRCDYLAELWAYFASTEKLCPENIRVRTPTGYLTLFKVWNTLCGLKGNDKLAREVFQLDAFPYEIRVKFIMMYDPYLFVSFVPGALPFTLPDCIERMLQDGKYILAGGAASLLVKQKQIKPLPSSDIDLFIFKGQEEEVIPELLALPIDNVLKIQTSSSVLTFVREYGKPNLQFIASSSSDKQQLLTEFDLNFNRVAYDGTQCYAMACALHDLFTNICSEGLHVPIKPMRLAKAHLRGLTLMEPAQEYLRNTIGWPLSDTIIHTAKYKRHYYVPGIPPEVQIEWMKYNGNDHAVGTIKPMACENPYATGGHHMGGIFNGSLSEYATTIQRHEREFKTLYQWKLPICTSPFIFDRAKHNDSLNRLQFTSKEDYDEWQDFLSLLLPPSTNIKSMMKRCVICPKDLCIYRGFKRQNRWHEPDEYLHRPVYDIYVKLCVDVKVTYNGLPVSQYFRSKSHTRVLATGFPCSYVEFSDGITQVQFKVTRLSFYNLENE